MVESQRRDWRKVSRRENCEGVRVGREREMVVIDYLCWRLVIFGWG